MYTLPNITGANATVQLLDLPIGALQAVQIETSIVGTADVGVQFSVSLDNSQQLQTLVLSQLLIGLKAQILGVSVEELTTGGGSRRLESQRKLQIGVQAGAASITAEAANLTFHGEPKLLPTGGNRYSYLPNFVVSQKAVVTGLTPQTSVGHLRSIVGKVATNSLAVMAQNVKGLSSAASNAVMLPLLTQVLPS